MIDQYRGLLDDETDPYRDQRIIDMFVLSDVLVAEFEENGWDFQTGTYRATEVDDRPGLIVQPGEEPEIFYQQYLIDV